MCNECLDLLNLEIFVMLTVFGIDRWHWLSHPDGGLSPRAAHTAVYHKETDSLYVFGGYNLNNVLSNLEVYRFETSRWEDEHGNELGMLNKVPGPAWAVSFFRDFSFWNRKVCIIYFVHCICNVHRI